MNHKDGVKTNPNVDNLEWINGSDNNKHAIALGLASTQNMKTKWHVFNDEEGFIFNDQDELVVATRYSKSQLSTYIKQGTPLRKGIYKNYKIEKLIM